jgi:nitroreductase
VKEALTDWEQRGIDRLFHGAPAALLVGGKNEASCPAEDALLAGQNILLAAHAMGLGSCLIGFAVEAMRRERRIGKSLGMKKDEPVYAVIALGYPRETFQRPAPRRMVAPRVWRGQEQ